MADITQNIVVQSTNLGITPNVASITFNPEPIQLNVYTQGAPGAGNSSQGQLLYNNANFITGASNTLVANGNVSFTNIANIKIAGGNNTYFLQTDGTGNLTWAVGTGNITGNGVPGGANTQIQFNDGGANFGGSAGFTFDKTSNVINMPGNTFVAGNLTASYFIGNGSGLTGLDTNKISNGNSNVIVYANSNVAVNITGNANVLLVTTAGANITGNLNVTNNISATSIIGTLTTAAQPNITSVGTLTNLSVTGNVNAGNLTGIFANGNSNISIPSANGNINVSVDGVSNGVIIANTGVTITNNLSVTGNVSTTGTTSIQQAKEKVTANSTGSTGTVNFDLLTQAILLKTSNATNNFTLNFRGNSTTTLNSIMNNNESITCTFINPNGTIAYYANVIQIDGNTITPLWAYPGAINSGTVSGSDMYTFNIIKTGTNTYKMYASKGGFV